MVGSQLHLTPLPRRVIANRLTSQIWCVGSRARANDVTLDREVATTGGYQRQHFRGESMRSTEFLPHTNMDHALQRTSVMVIESECRPAGRFWNGRLPVLVTCPQLRGHL